MDHRAVRARYDVLLDEAGPDRIAQLLTERSTAAGLTYGGRALCRVLRPLFVAQSTVERVHRRGRALRSALGKVLRDVGSDAMKAHRLQLSPHEQTLASIDGHLDAQDVIGRLDALIQPGGEPAFLEYNGESPGGIGYGDRFGDFFEEFEPMRRLREEVTLERIEAVPLVVDAFRDAWERFCHRTGRRSDTAPSVAIVDLADVPTRTEFEVFREAFEAAGLHCRILAPEDLSIEGDRLMASGEVIDVVYRRLLTIDIEKHPDACRPLIEAARAGLAMVADGFRAWTLSHKGLFALLDDPVTRPADLDDHELEAIVASLPWTRLLDTANTVGPGEDATRPLDDILRDRREELVLKACSSYGGQSVVLGWRCDESEWQAELTRAREGPGSAIVQHRVESPRESFPVISDHGVESVELAWDLCPYVLGGATTAGVGARLSSAEILNVAAGSGSATPVFAVR